jgi:hypothetical protein
MAARPESISVSPPLTSIPVYQLLGITEEELKGCGEYLKRSLEVESTANLKVFLNTFLKMLSISLEDEDILDATSLRTAFQKKLNKLIHQCCIENTLILYDVALQECQRLLELAAMSISRIYKLRGDALPILADPKENNASIAVIKVASVLQEIFRKNELVSDFRSGTGSSFEVHFSMIEVLPNGEKNAIICYGTKRSAIRKSGRRYRHNTVGSRYRDKFVQTVAEFGITRASCEVETDNGIQALPFSGRNIPGTLTGTLNKLIIPFDKMEGFLKICEQFAIDIYGKVKENYGRLKYSSLEMVLLEERYVMDTLADALNIVRRRDIVPAATATATPAPTTVPAPGVVVAEAAVVEKAAPVLITPARTTSPAAAVAPVGAAAAAAGSAAPAKKTLKDRLDEIAAELENLSPEQRVPDNYGRIWICTLSGFSSFIRRNYIYDEDRSADENTHNTYDEFAAVHTIVKGSEVYVADVDSDFENDEEEMDDGLSPS